MASNHAPVLHIHPSAQLGIELGQFIAALSKAAIEEHGYFAIALSGGSMPKIVASGLLPLKDSIEFDKWKVFFADERCVPLDDDDSNYKACKVAFLDLVNISESHIFKLDATLEPEKAAEAYAKHLQKNLKQFKQVPVFDLILLGMGPDGHTCSLFPGHPLLEENVKWVASLTDSPKPPPSRITLTYPVLDTADQVAFVATGDSKAALMPHMLGLETRTPSLPASRIQSRNGKVHWFIDEPAAAMLPNPKI